MTLLNKGHQNSFSLAHSIFQHTFDQTGIFHFSMIWWTEAFLIAQSTWLVSEKMFVTKHIGGLWFGNSIVMHAQFHYWLLWLLSWLPPFLCSLSSGLENNCGSSTICFETCWSVTSKATWHHSTSFVEMPCHGDPNWLGFRSPSESCVVHCSVDPLHPRSWMNGSKPRKNQL